MVQRGPQRKYNKNIAFLKFDRKIKTIQTHWVVIIR